MKHKLLLFLIVGLLASCQKKQASVDEVLASEDLEMIRKTRDAKQQEANQLRNELKALEDRIAELDPEIKNYDIVTTIVAKDSLFNHYVEVQGSVKTKDDTQIYPEMSGVMTRLYVREGQYVKRGALIATVDDGGLKQQIAQQQVQLDLAKTTFERQKRLWEQNIGSEMQYLQAKNNVEALEKGIASMNQQLKKVNVYAPFSGSVEQVITQQGQVVSPGATPIIRLVGLGAMYIEAEVPENYLPSVSRGTKAIVNLDAIETEYNSSVKRINNTINPASRSFIIEIGVPNNSLIKPNLIANVKINDYTSKNAILIPSDIVNEDAEGQQYVFVVDEMVNETVAKVKRVIVETGKVTSEGLIEITSGIEPDQKIIAEGSKTLSDGDEVEVLAYNPES